MSFWDRFRKKDVTLDNAEPNTVITVGMNDVHVGRYEPVGADWVDIAPPKITPSIKNCRRASNFPTVNGIINNLIMKTISNMVISGDNPEAVKHIEEMDKVWNLRSLMYEGLRKAIVDGEPFYEKVVRDGHAHLRLLAFDGEKALIKKIYDENSELVGYKQLVVRKSALKDWKGMEFWETYQEQQVITVDFDACEISNPILIEVDGEGQSLVKGVIDYCYELDSLVRMMAKIVHKSANIMVATIGNENRSEDKFDEEAKKRVSGELSDIHNDGVVIVPYGIELGLVGTDVLPKIENYIKIIKSFLFEHFNTPEAVFNNESSNRATAEVQIIDGATGYILFIVFCQQFVKSWLERDLINEELLLAGYAEGDAYINFLTNDPNLDNEYLTDSKEGSNQENNNVGDNSGESNPIN